MKKQPTIYQFDPVIYPYKLWVCVTGDINTVLNDNFTDTLGNSFDITDKYEAITCSVKRKNEPTYYGTIITFDNKNYMDIKNIAHESTHAAKFLCNHIDMEYSCDEAFEYLVGWIADCCYKVKKNKTDSSNAYK